MDSIIVLRELLGIIFSIMGLGMLVNTQGTMAVMDAFIGNKAFTWLGGVIALILGATIVALSGRWISGIPLMIAIIGWLALLKGIALVVIPDRTISFYQKINKSRTFVIAGIIVLVAGFILLA